MNILRISCEVPAVVERAGHTDVIKAVVKENGLGTLCREDAVYAPAFQHLRIAWFSWNVIRGCKRKAVANIKVRIATLSSWIVAILDCVAPVATGIVNRTGPGISSHKEKAFRCLLF